MTRRGLFLVSLMAPFAARAEAQIHTPMQTSGDNVLRLTPPSKPFLRIALEGFTHLEVTYQGETLRFTPDEIFHELKG